jgi:hypothetical protein
VTRTARALALLSPLLTFGPAPNGYAARVPLEPRLLFSSAIVSTALVAVDEKPYARPDIYSVSSSNRLAQLTFTGGEHPVPSPNGRLIAFSRGGEL